MRIKGHSAILFTACPGSLITASTPPPSTDGQELMDGDIHPAVDAIPLRSFKEYALLSMARNDFSGCLIVINGMKEGFYYKNARCFAMYGEHAPKATVYPVKLPLNDDNSTGISLSTDFESAFPLRNSAFLVTFSTDAVTPPGQYRTNIEVEGEDSVTYLPIVINVADAILKPVPAENLTLAAAVSDLEVMYTAPRLHGTDKPSPLYPSSEYTGLISQFALHDRMLYQAAHQMDPLLTHSLLSSLCEVKTVHRDDALLFHSVRRTLVNRLDNRFGHGNRYIRAERSLQP